jgi:hypothetical protein
MTLTRVCFLGSQNLIEFLGPDERAHQLADPMTRIDDGRSLRPAQYWHTEEGAQGLWLLAAVLLNVGAQLALGIALLLSCESLSGRIAVTRFEKESRVYFRLLMNGIGETLNDGMLLMLERGPYLRSLSPAQRERTGCLLGQNSCYQSRIRRRVEILYWCRYGAYHNRHN